MSDTGGLTTDSVPAAASNAITQSPDSTPAPPSAPPPAAPAGTVDPLEAPPDDQAVFSRSYVEKVRGEAQRYREEARSAQRYNEVFNVYEEADQQVWLDLARTWAQDP